MKNKRKSLTSDPRENIWWDNLEFDVSQENLPAEVYKKFLSVMRRFLKAKRKKFDPVTMIVNALENAPAGFSMQGRPAPVSESLSRVIDARSFAQHNIQLRIGLATSETREDIVWDMFRKGDIVPERHFVNKLSSGRQFFWATPTRCLENLCGTQEIRRNEYTVHPPEKADDVATTIRNLLGLSYMNEGWRLYRIDIPEEKLKAVKICAPTTLDSSPSCVFLPGDGTTRFGKTLNLTDLRPGAVLQPGAEEVVVEPIDFTEHFTVTQIGFVKGPLPSESDVWNALADIVKDRLAKRNAH